LFPFTSVTFLAVGPFGGLTFAKDVATVGNGIGGGAPDPVAVGTPTDMTDGGSRKLFNMSRILLDLL